MKDDVFTFLVGGKAGEGVKKAANVAAQVFTGRGRHIFQMDDYQSLIKGGHNFSVVSTATRKILSHYLEADLVVALDRQSYDLHLSHRSGDGVIVFNLDTTPEGQGLGVPFTREAKKYKNHELLLGVGAVAVLAAAVGMSREELQKLITAEYPRETESNLAYAAAIYEIVESKISGRFPLRKGERKNPILYGNEAVALGAMAGGLDLYFAYPMTPVSNLLHYLAGRGRELGVITVHPENEIGVANMAIGAAFAGARVMAGSSGGGFALMEEAFSLAGMTEAPVLFNLGSRSGPSTGVPTGTEQGDLNFALYQGHGEFPRLVASPADLEEAFYLTAELLDLVWRFQTPGILLTEKHLSESAMTVELNLEAVKEPEPLLHREGPYRRYLDTPGGVSPLLFPPSPELIKWSSYEHDELGIVTEEAEIIARMHEKRNRKGPAIADYLRGRKTVNAYGSAGPVIFTYGSTTMSVLESLSAGEIEATVVQPVYLEPLPVWELERYRGRPAIVVEQSCGGRFASLLREKAGIEARAVIKKYDGRPFHPRELAARIKEVM
ncbi:MAG: 2-oxoacid:acceptor oxidoreductase family protein [bacterium]|nr:2-oxoacid:acceptor oxidoreductase family protein [bacterium]